MRRFTDEISALVSREIGAEAGESSVSVATNANRTSKTTWTRVCVSGGALSQVVRGGPRVLYAILGGRFSAADRFWVGRGGFQGMTGHQHSNRIARRPSSAAEQNARRILGSPGATEHCFRPGLAIPRRVAPQQSPPPFHQTQPSYSVHRAVPNQGLYDP